MNNVTNYSLGYCRPFSVIALAIFIAMSYFQSSIYTKFKFEQFTLAPTPSYDLNYL